MRKRFGSFLACLAMAGSLLTVVAGEARACSCGNEGPDVAVATGGSVGVVTRLDDGGPEADFQVEESYGPPLPPRVGGQVDASGGSCFPFANPGSTVALIFRLGPSLQWRASFCGNVPLGEAFLRTQGPPRPESSGAVVAVATGRFGGAGIVSVDAAGRPVAWGPVSGDAVTACPGGRTVVLSAHEHDPVADRPVDMLRVVDVATLAVQRTVAVPEAGHSGLRVLRCRDELAREIDAVAPYYGEDGSPARLVVTGTAVRRTLLAGLEDVSVAPARFGRNALLGSTKGPKPSVVVVRGDGTRRTVLARTGVRRAQLGVAPDGRTVVLSGIRPGNGGRHLVRTFDLTTGRQIGSLAGSVGSDPIWVGHRLVARVEPGYLRPYTSLQVFDRRLRLLATSPAPQGYGLQVSGSDVVGYGSTRLMMAAPGQPGEPRKFGVLRFAAASDLTLLPGAQFDP